MRWHLVKVSDAAAVKVADRHYNRENVGARTIGRPGRRVVLLADTPTGRAVWVSSWQRYGVPGPEAWLNGTFRNEGAGLSSELVTEAVAATLAVWGPCPPPLGFVTFVDTEKVRPKRDPGRCYLRAGWERDGASAYSGHVCLRLPPELFPSPTLPFGAAAPLFLTSFPRNKSDDDRQT